MWRAFALPLWTGPTRKSERGEDTSPGCPEGLGANCPVLCRIRRARATPVGDCSERTSHTRRVMPGLLYGVPDEPVLDDDETFAAKIAALRARKQQYIPPDQSATASKDSPDRTAIISSSTSAVSLPLIKQRKNSLPMDASENGRRLRTSLNADDAAALEKTRKRREARARASAAKDAVAEMARLHADAIVAIDAEAREKQAKYEEKLLSKAASKAKADAEALEKRAAALDDQAAKAREAEAELEAKAEEARRAAQARLQRNARERKLRQEEEERRMLEGVAMKAEALKQRKEERKQKEQESQQRWVQAEQVRKIIYSDRAKLDAQQRQKREVAERARQEKAAEEKAEREAAAKAEQERQAERYEEARKAAELRAKAVSKARAKAAAEEKRRSQQEQEQRMLVLKVGLTGMRDGLRRGEGSDAEGGRASMPFSRTELEKAQLARQEAILVAARARQESGRQILEWSQQRRQGAFAEDEALHQLMKEQPLLPLRELPPNANAGGHAGPRAASCPAKATRHSPVRGLPPSFAARRKGQVCEGWAEWG